MIPARIFLSFFFIFLASSQLPAQTSGKVEREDVVIHYRVFGKGLPIVLLSGGPGASGSALLPIAKKLEKDYRLVVIDQRGTGLSKLDRLDETTITLENYVEDVEAVRQDLGIEKWLVLGHSWGGGLAMAFAAAHPDKTAGLVLIGSIGIDLEYLDYAFDNLKYSDAELAAFKFWSDPKRKAANPERAAYEYYRTLLPSRLFKQENIFLILENLVVEKDFGVIANLMTGDLRRIGYDLKPSLSKYPGPTLILQGRQGFLGGRTAEKILNTIPNAEINYIEKCGHFPFVEQPEKFYSGLSKFLEAHFK